MMKFLWVCYDYFCLINRLPLIFALLILSGEARSQLIYEIYLNNNYAGAVAYRQETNAISQHIEYEYHLNAHVDNIADLFTGKTQEPDLNSPTKTIILITIHSHSSEQYPRTRFACKKMNPDRVSSGWDSNYPIKTVTKNVIVDPIIDPVITFTAIYPDSKYRWITGLLGNPLYVKIDTTDCRFKTWQNSDVTFPAITEMTTVKFNKAIIDNITSEEPPETVSALISSGKKSLTLEYRLCHVESMAQWSKQLHSPPTPGFVTCDNPFQHNLTRPCEKCDTTKMDWESSDTKPETEVAPAGKTTGTGFQIRTVADMISPKNGQFVEDLQRNGHDIYLKLQNDIARKPKDRTVPMPGMEKVIHEINEFVTETVLTTTSMTTGDKCIYQQLQSDLNQLKTNGCPWNQSFILTYKAAHLISFFNKDRAAHYHTPKQKEPSDALKSPRSYYKKGATLKALNALPWQDALNAPENFLNQLRVLWHSFNLEIHPYAKKRKPLDNMSNFGFPCADKLNFDFFNRTWMLGIHPFGFSTAAEIQYDGLYGLCADFMEHDILHSYGDRIINPDIYVRTQFLLDSIESSQQVERKSINNRRPILIKGQIDFETKALQLLMFYIQHEKNVSWVLGPFYRYIDCQEQLEEKWRDTPIYNDQKERDLPSADPCLRDFKKTAIFMYNLERSGFWAKCLTTISISFCYEEALCLYSESKNNILNRTRKLEECIRESCFGRAWIDPPKAAIHASVLKQFFDDAMVIDRSSIWVETLKQLPNNYGHALELTEHQIDFPLDALSLYLSALIENRVTLLALDNKYNYIEEVDRIAAEHKEIAQFHGNKKMLEPAAVFVMALTHCKFWQAETKEEAQTRLLQSHHYYNAYLLNTLYSRYSGSLTGSFSTIGTGSILPPAFDSNMHLLSRPMMHDNGFRLIRIEPHQAILLPVPVNKENWSFFPSENPQVTAFRTDDAIHLFNHRNEHKIFKGITGHNYDDASGCLTLEHVNGPVTIMLKGDNAPEVIDIQ